MSNTLANERQEILGTYLEKLIKVKHKEDPKIEVNTTWETKGRKWNITGMISLEGNVEKAEWIISATLQNQKDETYFARNWTQSQRRYITKAITKKIKEIGRVESEKRSENELGLVFKRGMTIKEGYAFGQVLTGTSLQEVKTLLY